MRKRGWIYKTGERVELGDFVKVSKKLADSYNLGSQYAVVVDRFQYVTVKFCEGTRISVDCDMRSLTFVDRKSS